jgi:hypothetical protein
MRRSRSVHGSFTVHQHPQTRGKQTKLLWPLGFLGVGDENTISKRFGSPATFLKTASRIWVSASRPWALLVISSWAGCSHSYSVSRVAGSSAGLPTVLASYLLRLWWQDRRLMPPPSHIRSIVGSQVEIRVVLQIG